MLMSQYKINQEDQFADTDIMMQNIFNSFFAISLLLDVVITSCLMIQYRDGLFRLE